MGVRPAAAGTAPDPLPLQPESAAGVTAAEEATGLPESVAAWDEARGSQTVPPRRREAGRFARWWTPVRRRRGWFMLAAVVLVLLLPGYIAALPPRKIAGGENGAVQNLKALATAQAQYHKKYDCYADAGWRLNAAGTLIAADLKNAFEDWQSNGDGTPCQPKAGYYFRMLHGDLDSGPWGFYADPTSSSTGMLHWAATARAAEPNTSGEYQYFIGEEGTVYCCLEPLAASPRYKQFMLDRAMVGNLSGWKVYKR